MAPFFRWSMATTWAVVLPSRGAAASCVWAARLPLGVFLAAVTFLSPYRSWARPGRLCTAFGLTFSFRLYGLRLGFAASPSCWILFQIQVAAVVRSLNFLTGVTPGQAVPNGHQPLRWPAGRQFRSCVPSGPRALNRNRGIGEPVPHPVIKVLESVR